MKLRDTVEFKSHIIPICLPGSSGSLDGRKAAVTGWGVTENGLRSEILKEVEVDILPKDLCREWYKGKSTIGEEFFCAGYEEGKKDSCQVRVRIRPHPRRHSVLYFELFYREILVDLCL